jgi:putative heme iron utilization protein
MDQDLSRLLGDIIRGQTVASLATLHDGDPFASMIPYATWSDARGGRLRFVAHVSRLSAHTRDMLESPRVCLLITAPQDAGGVPQALPRVSIPALATFVDARDPEHEPLARTYLATFPHAAEWFQLGDFSIVAFDPTSVRFIAGFARAMNVSLPQLAAAVGAAGGDASA